jgi:hypothetical protein
MILSGYTLEKLTDDGDLRLSRATADAGAASILVLTPAGPAPSTVSLARLQHIHGLRDQLEPAWAARPQALEHRDGRPILGRGLGGTAIYNDVERLKAIAPALH